MTTQSNLTKNANCKNLYRTHTRLMKHKLVQICNNF